MADPVEQADAKLKAADAAWTASRSRIHPSNTPLRQLNNVISDGGENPSSTYHEAYLRLKAQYDANVAAEAAAGAAYRAAQEN
jgi:hypothetical protein